MKKKSGRFALSIIFSLFLTAILSAQNPTLISDADIEILEQFNELRDYENGLDYADKLLVKSPENNKIRAWQIIFSARAGEAKKAVERGEKLLAETPSDEFVLYALGNAYLQNSNFDKALNATEKLMQIAPENPKNILLRGYALMSKKRFAEALQLLDDKADLFAEKSLWHTARAEIFYRQKEKAKSFAAFDSAIAANPNRVTANYAAGFYLNAEKNFAKSLPILKHAVALSPKVFHIRRAFLDAVLKSQPQDTAEKREIIINREIESFLKDAGETPKNLFAAATEYRKLEMPEKQKEFENRLLEKFSLTRESERILMSRLQRFDANNELKRAELIKKYREFLARPQHFEPKSVGEIYNRLLYNLRSDKDFSDADFLKLAEKAVVYEGLSFFDPYGAIAKGLLERNRFAEAEKYAKTGAEIFEKRLAKARRDENYSDFAEGYDRADILNIWGETLLRQKKYDEAEKVFLQSVASFQKYNLAFRFLGEIYEATNRLDRAEDAYISEITFIPRDKPKFDALKNLYQKRNGNLTDFEAYLVNVKKLSKQKMREFIVADKHREPQDLTAFNLPTLDGKMFSSNDLKGKIVVVNIWATWCAPCVREMPDWQLLYKKYRKSKDVAVITINSEEDAETVKKFMVGSKYDFPVLLSGDYLTDLRVNALPTTWFIDKRGKIVYTQAGYTKFLFEEFDWRIEELRK